MLKFFSFVFCFPVLITFGQNIEQLTKLNKDMVKISGGVNFNTTVYQTDNSNSMRDPFAYYASGNLTVSVLDFSFPFTYSISNQNKNFTQPSNITALHPSYKWIKTHVGRISMSFSPYSVSGINFSGVGVDLTPKKFNLSAMYGQINKPIEYSQGNNTINDIVYERNAFALMMTYQFWKSEVKIVSMKAFDDPNSLKFVPGLSPIKPKDNLVTELIINTKLIKNLTLDVDMASSMITNDVRLQQKNEDKRWFTSAYPLINGNSTTSNYNAYKTGLNYSLKNTKWGITYERINPGYQTLGALYFNNDFENYTFAPSVSLFQNKLNFAINTGLQKNNLDKSKASKTERWIGSLNVSWLVFKDFTSTFSYSNFSSFTRNNPMKDPFSNQPVLIDTANVYQISQNFTTCLNYSFGKKNKSTVATSFTYQKSTNITGKLENASAFGIRANGTDKPFDCYVNTLNYNYTLDKHKIMIGLCANSNYSQSEIMRNWFCGPTLNLTKNFGKEKPTLSGGMSYNVNYQNNLIANNLINYRISTSYAPKLVNEKYGSFNVSLNAMFLNKLPTSKELKKLHELTVIANVSYNFN